MTVKILAPDQEATPVQVQASDVLVALQVIARLVEAGRIRDTELAPVGICRQNLHAALEKSTGVNFDRARDELFRHLQAQAAAQAKAAQSETPQKVKAQ